jgi:hypothetical protein
LPAIEKTLGRQWPALRFWDPKSELRLLQVVLDLGELLLEERRVERGNSVFPLLERPFDRHRLAGIGQTEVIRLVQVVQDLRDRGQVSCAGLDLVVDDLERPEELPRRIEVGEPFLRPGAEMNEQGLRQFLVEFRFAEIGQNAVGRAPRAR